MEPWQTFTVKVHVTRGRREVHASVALSHVTGVVGSVGVVPRPLWRGVIAQRADAGPVTPEDAAVWAQAALEKAFPRLF